MNLFEKATSSKVVSTAKRIAAERGPLASKLGKWAVYGGLAGAAFESAVILKDHGAGLRNAALLGALFGLAIGTGVKMGNVAFDAMEKKYDTWQKRRMEASKDKPIYVNN